MKRSRDGTDGAEQIRLYRRAVLAAVCTAAVILLVMLTGCVTRHGGDKKIRDLEFTVVDMEDVPQELKDTMDQNEKSPFQMTYADQGQLYIAEGYGEQPTTGYSVEVLEVFETEEALHIRTNLLGPEKGEEIKEIATFPCVVVQLGYIEKDVLFD